MAQWQRVGFQTRRLGVRFPLGSTFWEAWVGWVRSVKSVVVDVVACVPVAVVRYCRHRRCHVVAHHGEVLALADEMDDGVLVVVELRSESPPKPCQNHRQNHVPSRSVARTNFLQKTW